jgi:SAM-dependent methyltransferase
MNWKKYWNSYPRQFGEAEYLKQVKNTVAGQPIPFSQILESIATISSRLELKPDDVLLDLCCGNGLISKGLAGKCRRVVGVDFSEPLIRIANKAHQQPNVSYFWMNVLEFPGTYPTAPRAFTKILVNSGLQYFRRKELRPFLRIISESLSDSGIALLTAIPDREQWAAFYNSRRRRWQRAWRQILGTDQMGTWWTMGELERACLAYDMRCEFLNASQAGLNYRFDVRITRTTIPVAANLRTAIN